MADELITLSRAEELGYGKANTLLKRLLRNNFKAIKPGNEWLTTEAWLKEDNTKVYKYEK